MSAVSLAFHKVGLRNIFGHEDVRLQTRAGGIGSQRARGIAGRWDRQLSQSIGICHGHRGAQPASFEAAGRIQSFIFYKDVGVFLAG